jgi:hypothetical protein
MNAHPRKPNQSHSRLRGLLARFGLAAFLFFAIKGLIWLAIGGGIAFWASR